MSRLAMDQITITDVTDGEKGVSVKIVTPFYALGTAAPDKPTVNPPASVWTTTEPEYVKGKNLYTTQRTVLEDSTFSYSDVSLDSSYKASEQAITTADTANTTAGEAKTTAGEAKTTSGEAKTTAGEAKTIATEAKTASITNKNNLDSEIEARNQAIANLKTSVDKDVEAVSQKAADAQKAGDDAANDLTTFRTSTESQLTSINGLVGGVRTDVNAVSEKATTLASGLDSANTKITSTSENLTGLTNTVSNVSKAADDAMALSTTNHQDLAGFQTKVQQTYSTKEDTLNQVTTVNQKADAISATLSKDYQKKADSDAKYSTKAELTATSNSITASVAEIYATKSVVEALKNIADKAIETWQGPGAPTLTNMPASDWTTADLKKQHSGDVYYDTDSGFAYRFGSADGTTYKWGRISDSDITKALNLASKAQETADGAVAGVTKLNTDIPVTYATKSDVKITTDGIKADVVEAKRIGQTGVDNAAALAIRADGIDATLSQQATNIDKNVKSITQLGLRADGISTSVSQVDAKADLAIANAQELVINGGFETGDTTGWSVNATCQVVDDIASANSGRYYLNAGSSDITQSIAVRVIPNHVYRFSGWYRRPSTNSSIIGGIRFQKSADGTTYVDWLVTDFGKSKQDNWTYFSIDGTIPSDGSVKYARYRLVFANTTGVVQHFDDLSFKDITESAAAQKDATSALSQYTTLSQDLTGFKTQVTQTYETKEASTSKATTAQQNLQGFKNTVQNDYLSKTDAGTKYSTKTETTQTAEALTNKITNVGKDATSALTRITTAEQDVKGFKNTVSATYATKNDAGTLNLITNGDLSNGMATWTATGGTATVLDSNCPYFSGKMVQFVSSAIGGNNNRIYTYLNTGHVVGTSYSISFYARCDHDNDYVHVNIGANDSEGKIGNASIGTAWKRYSFQYTASVTGSLTFWLQGAGTIQLTNVSVYTTGSLLTTDEAAQTYSTKSYTDQTAKSISLGVVEEYKNGKHGSALATQSDISIAKDSITSTVSQTYATKQALDSTNDNVTQALANAQELIVNGGFETGDMTGWKPSNTSGMGINANGTAAHSGKYRLSGNLPTSGDAIQFLSNSFPVVQGRILRASGWFWNDAGAYVANISIQFNDGSISDKTDISQLGDGWKYASIDVTVPSGVSSGQFRLAYYHPDSTTVFTRSDDLSVKDVTEVAQLQSDVEATYASKTSVTQTATQITSQVETKYATKDALSQTNSKVDQKADEWSVQLSTISSRADAITQTTDAISDQIANANSNINNVGSALSDEISSRKAYMSFNQDQDGDPVLSLGSSSSPNKVELSNDRLSFKSNDSEVAYIGDDQMNINNTNILKSLRLGNFMFLLRPDGHMVLTRATPELLTNTALLTNTKGWALSTGASYVNSEQAIKVDGDKVIGSFTRVFVQYISDSTVLYNRTMRVSVDLKRISGSGKTWRFEIIPGESWAMIVNTDDIPTDRYKTFTADISVASDKSIKQFACLSGAYADGATGSFYARNMSIIDVTGI